MKRLALPLVISAALLLSACSRSASQTTSTTAITTAGSQQGASTTIAPGATSTTVTASTTAPVSSIASLTGTEKELAMASINGATHAALSLNTAMLQKGGWTAAAATTESTTVVQKRSTRESAIVISALQSAPPKGYSVTAYGSAGIVVLYDGAMIQTKALTGLIEYLEVSQKGASVCLRPSIDGSKDSAQIDTSSDGYRNLPVGKLVLPNNEKGWIVLLRTSQKSACRLSLDTMAAP